MTPATTGAPTAGSGARAGRWAAILASGGVLLTGLGGCCLGDRDVGDPPRDAQEALERVNRNQSRLSGTLQCAALVSLSFRDADGTTRRFIGHEAAMLFRAPRCLIFDVRSLTGTIAQFGSNDARYWVWIEPEVKKLWWGDWNTFVPRRARGLPIDPGDLLDGLMLRPLPALLPRSISALLRVEGRDHRLLYVRNDASEALGLREIRLQPFKPHLPIEIIDRGVDGRVIMRAEIDNYQPIEGGGPLTPRRYVITWPRDATELRIDLLRVRRAADVDDFCDFPARWPGEVEQVDVTPVGPQASRRQ